MAHTCGQRLNWFAIPFLAKEITARVRRTEQICSSLSLLLLCAGRVPVVPVHTTAAVCGTAVRSSLGSTGPLQWSNNSSVCFKHLLLSPVLSCCSQQTQGVMGTALNRRRELRARCTASASRSSAEAASSVLSTSPESWIACVGRANSSTWHPPAFQNLLAIGKQIYGQQGLETIYRNQKQSEKHEGPVNLMT